MGEDFAEGPRRSRRRAAKRKPARSYKDTRSRSCRIGGSSPSCSIGHGPAPFSMVANSIPNTWRYQGGLRGCGKTARVASQQECPVSLYHRGRPRALLRGPSSHADDFAFGALGGSCTGAICQVVVDRRRRTAGRLCWWLNADAGHPVLAVSGADVAPLWHRLLAVLDDQRAASVEDAPARRV